MSCDHPSCKAPGNYRAPKGRDQPNQYWWFCRQHVQEYNRTYNAFAGMSPQEAVRAEFIDSAPPRWSKLSNGGHHAFVGKRRIPNDVSDARRTCLETLGLSVDATDGQIKTRFRSLVKRYGAKKGDRSSEVRKRKIMEAYNYLIVPRGPHGHPLRRSAQ
jgi:hypothetical protein